MNNECNDYCSDKIDVSFLEGLVDAEAASKAVAGWTTTIPLWRYIELIRKERVLNSLQKPDCNKQVKPDGEAILLKGN